MTTTPATDELAAIETAEARLHNAEPEEILEWVFQRYGAGVTLASAFGNTADAVLMDMVAKVAPGTEVFYLDTDFLFPETHEFIAKSREKYGDRINLRMYKTNLTPEAQTLKFGKRLWERHPDQCCEIRKVEPIHQALNGKRAWIAGIRRDQSETRASAPAVTWDGKFGLAKANPLVTWDEKSSWAYIFANDVPYNPLHDRNYPTVGCTNCTRAVMPGEDQRAGRWSGTDKIECGLHLG